MRVDYYILCLDTTKYAGNFEREMTAYATGSVGDCGVGDEESDRFFEETKGLDQDLIEDLRDAVISRGDDRGCSRPCAIQPGPANNYHTIGIFLGRPLENDALKLVIKRSEEYLTATKHASLTGVRLVTMYVDEKEEIIDWKNL